MEKDANFYFDKACLEAFEELKSRLITIPIMIIPDWNEPFEIMCDASDFAIRALLCQRHDKKFKAIYYERCALNEGQENCTTIEKEILAVVFSYDKFRPYIIGSKVFIYIDHASIQYLMKKKDANPKLLTWVFGEYQIYSFYPHILVSFMNVSSI